MLGHNASNDSANRKEGRERMPCHSCWLEGSWMSLFWRGSTATKVLKYKQASTKVVYDLKTGKLQQLYIKTPT